jgi:urocanate hydratase
MTIKRNFDVTGGRNLRCKGWRQEGLLRLLENVLAVGEDPGRLVVYAAFGRAARDWPSYDKIVESLLTMNEDETLIVQSGKPIGLVKTHVDAPIVVMANCNLVGQWATADHFYELEKKGLICWGGLTAGDWQYIGSQGVIQGTYEIFVRIAERHFGGDLSGRLILTAGLGGMGGSQPLAGRLAKAITLCVEIDEKRIDRRLADGYLDCKATSLGEALDLVQNAKQQKSAVSIGLCGNAADIYPSILARGIIPDIVTDQTSAHDLLYGYIPAGYSLAEVGELRKNDPDRLMNASIASIVKHVNAMLDFQSAGSIVFDNGNMIRTHARSGGVANAFSIPIFTEAYLRPLFSRGIGPFRWVALSNDPQDIRKLDDLILELFPENKSITNWIRLAREHVPFQGLPARIGWLGHGDRTRLAQAANRMVREGILSGPIAFTRDHLDAGAMAHPNIMTENMLDGSDAVGDWPLLNAMLHCSSKADLVAIHSGGGGYAGYMTSAGVTIVADGTGAADDRLQLSLTNDTTLGIMRYADAGYPDALDEVRRSGVRHFGMAAAE